jgi:hypothetical protein
MTCPNCQSTIPWDRRAARRGFFCRRCGSEIRVSEGYARTMVLISLIIGFGLVWLPVFQGHGAAFLWSCVGFIALLALGFPVAGAILFLLVRLAPIVISPPLVARHFGSVCGLGLNGTPSSDQGKVQAPETRRPSDHGADPG